MRAMIVGNSDGIGLALTRRLIDTGWSVAGLSRRAAPVGEAHVVDVTAPQFQAALAEVGDVDLCVYAAGIGEAIERDDLAAQTRAFEVNLLGAARTAEVVLPRMLAAGALGPVLRMQRRLR